MRRGGAGNTQVRRGGWLTTHDDVRTILREVLADARRLHGYDKEVTLAFDLRGLCAGRAYYSEHHIRLNAEMVEKYPQEVRKTVAHEVAHLVSYWKYGKLGAGHGVLWRSIALDLGDDGIRCHSMPLTKARRTRHYVYRNDAGREAELRARTHRVLQSSPNARARLKGDDWVITGAHFTGKIFLK